MVRLAAGSFYKRLIRESSNLALAKNRYLRALRQNAEDTYRINMGMNNTRVYLERQIYSLRFMGISLQGFENLGGQLTLLCFLAGGAAAFLSYWNRSDNYYIVLYGVSGYFPESFPAGCGLFCTASGMNSAVSSDGAHRSRFPAFFLCRRSRLLV